MNRAIFGKRMLTRSTQFPLLLLPRGAVASRAEGSMSQALVGFVMAATERALFHLEELPADAVAVFRVCQLAGDLDDKTIDYLFCAEQYAAKADQTVQGLRLIEMTALAEVIESARVAWNTSLDRPLEERRAVMARFATSRAQEAGIVGRCSDWVRSYDRTLILGDGRLDTVYKEVMKQLYRCNPNYAERRAAEDERRLQLRLKPVGAPPLGPCSLNDLIAEMQRKWDSP